MVIKKSKKKPSRPLLKSQSALLNFKFSPTKRHMLKGHPILLDDFTIDALGTAIRWELFSLLTLRDQRAKDRRKGQLTGLRKAIETLGKQLDSLDPSLARQLKYQLEQGGTKNGHQLIKQLLSNLNTEADVMLNRIKRGRPPSDWHDLVIRIAEVLANIDSQLTKQQVEEVMVVVFEAIHVRGRSQPTKDLMDKVWPDLKAQLDLNDSGELEHKMTNLPRQRTLGQKVIQKNKLSKYKTKRLIEKFRTK